MIALQIILESSSSNNPGWLLLAGPIAAVAVYWGLFQYYRNTNKSHSFEHETGIESQPITGSDQKVDTVRGTQRTAINGNNVRDYRQRVKRV
ncbi:MAG TPA: hypothetical protein PKD84_02985 [Propionicimonas sp.]|nr:hypothetical protein [Propionicimonas sp.]